MLPPLDPAVEPGYILVPARDADGEVGLFHVATDAPGLHLTSQQTSDGRPHAQVELGVAERAVEMTAAYSRERVQFIAFACQHLHGGIGIDVDYPLHRYFTWAIQLEHELGSARHQLDRLGRHIAAAGMPAS